METLNREEVKEELAKGLYHYLDELLNTTCSEMGYDENGWYYIQDYTHDVNNVKKRTTEWRVVMQMTSQLDPDMDMEGSIIDAALELGKKTPFGRYKGSEEYWR